MNRTLAMAFVGLSLLAGISQAASLTPSLVNAVPASGNTAYNFMATLTAGARLDPAATNGANCGPIGTAQCNPAGTFFTLYDVIGFQSASVSAANWFETVQFLGVTPGDATGVTDNPNLVNVSFFYTGPVVNGPTTVSGFQIVSSDAVQGSGNFSSQWTNNILVTAVNGQTGVTTGAGVAGPFAVTTGTPEPGTLLLLGFGLATVGFAARRFRH